MKSALSTVAIVRKLAGRSIEQPPADQRESRAGAIPENSTKA
jgi:hypothetical protein